MKDQYWDGYTPADVDRFKYDYDYASNRTYRDIDSAIYATNDKDQAYTYDGLHRLKTMDEGTLSGSTISTKKFAQDWTLDQLGNWATFKQDDDGSGWDLDQDRDSNDVNEITDITETGPVWIHPAYDAAGNMTEGPKPGAETTKHKYVYDAWNRLVKVTDNSDNSVAEFEYDGLHRRIVKTDTAANPDVTYDYYYNTSWQVLEVRKDADTDPLEQYTWHPHYIDALAMRTYDADTDGVLSENSDGDHYYTHDANFNVTAVTDDSGSVLERYQYSPYGELTVLDDDFSNDADGVSDIENAITFTGRSFDVATGLYDYRFREYHPSFGRFISRDPLEYAAIDANFYNYVMNAPADSLDPWGLAGPGPGGTVSGAITIAAGKLGEAMVTYRAAIAAMGEAARRLQSALCNGTPERIAAARMKYEQAKAAASQASQAADSTIRGLENLINKTPAQREVARALGANFSAISSQVSRLSQFNQQFLRILDQAKRVEGPCADVARKLAEAAPKGANIDFVKVGIDGPGPLTQGGVFIARGTHVVVRIDGVIYDAWNKTGIPYNVWVRLLSTGRGLGEVVIKESGTVPIP